MSPFHLASPASVIAFTFVVAFVLTCFVFGVYQANAENPKAALRRSFYAMAGACAWMILISAIVDSGVLDESPRTGIPLLFFLMIACSVALAFLRTGKWLSALPVWTLIGFQAFRLPLELILHEWAKQGTVPTAMTWSGSNFDVITGVAALVFAPLSVRSVRAAQIFNALGFLLLLNVMRIAMTSSPPLQLLMHLPYAWIGSVCVTGALAGHLILFRKLRA
jgi:hypothetical protein